jgi:spore coat polysaccharide biosynthesis protein SpsF
MERRVCIITQARMTSTRLPGKVLMQVGEKTLLDIHLDRLEKTNYPIVVATTTNVDDDPIFALCEKRNIACVRGSEQDVLSRFHQAYLMHPADCIVRVTSDCPLIDPGVIHRCVDAFYDANDSMCYVSNCFPRTYARGFDTEVFSAEMLEEAQSTSHDAFEREHVTPRFWQNKEGKFVLRNIEQSEDHSSMRITVDTSDDFRAIQTLIESYGAADLSQPEIEKILIHHPEIGAINAHVEQKKNPS